jgi:hypothetical protein
LAQRKKVIADTIEATRIRKERRNALREAYSLHKLTDTLTTSIIAAAARQEYTPSVAIYDIREYHPQREVGVCVLGGFIGELLLTINALNDYIMSNPHLVEFKLTSEQIEKFLEEWMRSTEFPEGTCVVKITKEASNNLTNLLKHESTE